MKKVVAGALLLGTVFAGGNVFADEVEKKSVVSPSSEVYPTVQLMEAMEVELTENPVEQVLLLDENADESLLEAEVALEENNEDALIKAINNMIASLEQMKEALEASKTEEVDPVVTEEDSVEAEESTENEDVAVSEPEEELVKKASQRGVNLRWMLENKDLPAPAKAGIAKAIANQERAWAKQAAKNKVEKVEETPVIEVLEVPVVEEPKVEEVPVIEEPVVETEENVTTTPVVKKEVKQAEKAAREESKATWKAIKEEAKAEAKAEAAAARDAVKAAREEAKSAWKAAKDEAKAQKAEEKSNKNSGRENNQ